MHNKYFYYSFLYHCRARATDKDKSGAPAAKRLAMSSSPPPASADLGQVQRELSPEQVSRMERNKMEAKAKFYARRLGAETIGSTWVQALLPEFKKPYMEKVSFPQHLLTSSIKNSILTAVDCVYH